MDKIKILWVDDEIDLLKPHILFLEKKNYEVTTCNNGLDAIGIFEENNFDIVCPSGSMNLKGRNIVFI